MSEVKTMASSLIESSYITVNLGDPLVVGHADDRVLDSYFVRDDGMTIHYKPRRAKGPWQPIFAIVEKEERTFV